MNITQILEYLGTQATEEMVSDYFGGKSLAEVLAELDDIWPHDDNRELAEAIVSYLA